MNSASGKWEAGAGDSPPPTFTPEEVKCVQDNHQEYLHHDTALGEGVENAHRKLWLQFQGTASQMTKMYREGQANPALLWHCFQLSAGALTQLYKDAVEEIGVVRDRAYKAGYARAKHDLGTWAKTSKRRYVRRDELLSVIALALPAATSANLTLSSVGRVDSTSGPGAACALNEEESLADRGAGELEALDAHDSPLSPVLFAHHLPQSPNRLKRHRSSSSHPTSPLSDDYMDLFTIKRQRRN